jgi:LacI family transcriptional regulator/LacI family repressor for deo operon, udp, cdd, tsx, nupC, and nupG
MAATIKQVAERAGVSTATVSYVLNGTGVVTEATRQRVLSAVAELHYQPSYAARSMRSRSRTLGLALPAPAGRLADPAMAEVLAGLSDAAAARGYSLLLAAGEAGEDPAAMCLRLIQTGRVDGMVLLELEVDDARARALQEAGLPHVCAGPPPGESPFVAVDVHDAAAQAVQHLLGLGHRRIALIQLPSDMAESEPRYAGYVQALEEAGVKPDPQLVVEAGRHEEAGFLAMQELLAAPEPPSAVVAASDELAFGAMHALYDAGLAIGRDVSMVGFDDVPLAAHARPALTAMRQPRQRLGACLARLLIDMITGRSRRRESITLGARLVVRQSSGPVRRD